MGKKIDIPSVFGLNAGDLIDGRFSVVDVIGQGGMGVVLRVHHLEWDRELAVKLPLPNMVSSRVMRERYLREAETWIALGAHPHIARCWFVKSLAGVPGLFLDYLPGGSLDDLLKQGQIVPGDLPRILSLIIEAAEGLAYAHSHGVVHRDVKPDNFLLSEHGRLCVTDFGLVKGLQRDEPEVGRASLPPGKRPVQSSSHDSGSLGLTGVGAYLGTPRYGAPEQWGRAESVGPPADIYALGIILYEMLCGRRPFDTKAEELTVEVLLERHRSQPPPDPRTFHRDIPAPIVELVMACLVKDPELRPQEMDQVVEALSPHYERYCGQRYQPPPRLPEVARPDILNNIAVSFYSIGQVERARQLLTQGLRRESGHPECLYNLVQLDRRAGAIDEVESLRRLRQAGATVPLALLCLEEGLGRKAVELLGTVAPSLRNGLYYRTLGDAQMYAQDYLAAKRSYQKAHELMPMDQPTRYRKLLAIQGARGLDGHVLFPSSEASHFDRAPDADLLIELDFQSEGILGFAPEEAVYYDLWEHRLAAVTPRESGHGVPRAAWTSPRQVLVQDDHAYELWTLPKLQMAKRTEGIVLAVTPALKKLLIANREGLFLLDQEAKKRTQLKFPSPRHLEGRIRAAFSPMGNALCLVTADGTVAQLAEDGQVHPLSWPEPLAHPSQISALSLGQNGLLVVGYQNGEILAFDFAQRRTVFHLQLPFPLERIVSDRSGSVLLVVSTAYSGVLSLQGEVLHRFQGPIAISADHTRAIAWQKGRLTLYELHPFRRIRGWTQEVPPPKKLTIAADGRLALSLGHNGEYHVWEVDEENRVYERGLLLCPGRSYEELVAAYERYRHLLTSALEAFRESDLSRSAQTLAEARKVEGFGQAPEALELQWQLLGQLGRGRLEGVWERLGIGPRAGLRGALSSDGRWLAAALGETVTCYFNQKSETTSVWSHERPSALLLTSFISEVDDQRNPGLLLLDRSARGGLFRAPDGQRLMDWNLGRVPLEQASFSDNTLFYLDSENRLGCYRLQEERRFTTERPLDLSVLRIYPWSQNRLLVLHKEGMEMFEIQGEHFHRGSLTLPATPPDSLSWLGADRERGLVMWGFQDGTVWLTTRDSSRLVHNVQLGVGAISGITLCPELALGIACTARGRLVCWALDSGQVLDRFPADASGLTEVQLSESGRFLVTLSGLGELKLWETCFEVAPEGQHPTLDWLPKERSLSALGRLLSWT